MRVILDGVTSRDDLADQRRVFGGAGSDAKERRAHAMAIQNVQDFRRDDWIGPSSIVSATASALDGVSGRRVQFGPSSFERGHSPIDTTTM
jgi:hypothetical protein